MFKRVLVIWMFMLVYFIGGTEVLMIKADLEITGDYEKILEEYNSQSTKESEDTLRKLAYEVEVTEEELNKIRDYMEEVNMYKYTSYENMRLVHFYSVILNRYIPSEEYRDTVILTEYVFDGLLDRIYLLANTSENVSPYTAGMFLTLLMNIENKETTQKDQLIKRVVNDFEKYANADEKIKVYTWINDGLPYKMNAENFMSWRKFQLLLTKELNRIEKNII